jgi:hypothetical protein
MGSEGYALGPDGCHWVDFASARTAGTVVDSSGAPADQVVLRFWRHSFFTNTPLDLDADGAFTVKLVPGEDYDVDAFLGATSVWDLDRLRRVHLGTVRPGEQQVTLRLPEAPVVVASGLLVDKRGAPMPGWELYASQVDDAGNEIDVSSTTTDAEGRYRVVSWRGGRIRIHARGPDGQTWRISQSSTDEATGEVRHELRPAIVGKVVVDDGGTPAGATVRVWRDGGVLDRCVAVNASGAFDFDDTTPFTDYEIGVELSGYETVERRPVPYDALDVRLDLVGLGQRIEGRLVNWLGEPVRCAWIRFVPAGARRPVQAMTGIDGAFRTVEARDTEYEAFVLVPADDGRLVAGPKVGECRGGQTSLVLRTPR